ncbi:MAG TPA: TonB-dependent receptor [Dokdonella sp.]
MHSRTAAFDAGRIGVGRRALAPALALAFAALRPALAADVPAADAAAAPAPADADTTTLNDIVVTGTRGNGRTVADSPVPIDVIEGAELQKANGANATLKTALEKLAPSFIVNARYNSSVSTVSTPAGLRGMSGAHVLVLVNGKRRHNSALATTAGDSQASSANPVDLDFIPVAAVDHIEILRDGAAAQYGSDAIAGVINVILKSADSAGTLSTTAGRRYRWNGITDGDAEHVAGEHGFKLGDGGFLDLAADVQHQDWTLRDGASSQNFFFPLAGGAPDPRESTVDKRASRGGTPRIKAFNLEFNAELPLGGGLSAYGFGTFGRRNAELGQTYRLMTSVNVIPELLEGVVLQPTTYLHETDYQLAGGLKGDLSGWAWDLSTTYGRDKVDVYEKNTVNPSLGPASPRDFATYTPVFDQWTTNLDVTRPFEIGLAQPLQLSWGFEHRYERYQVHAEDPLAYANGGYVFPDGPLAGQPAAIGAQAAVLILPEDATDLDRNDEAAYVDAGVNLTEKWYVATAARFEHYDDSAGNTRSGKLTSRYDLTPEFAVRGTLSNGFRAPSLSQSGFASGSQGPYIIDGVIAGITTSRIAKPDSALGRALGATPLKPEKSVNASLGFTWQATSDLSFDVDAYRIRLDDRIARSTVFGGAGVSQILADNGFDPNQTVSYNTNGIDTLTRGVDVVGTYTQNLESSGLGVLRWNLGFNWNETTIEHVKATPPELAALGLTLFDRIAQSYLTAALPKTKLILGTEWQLGKFDVTLRNTRYGSVKYLTSNTADYLRYDAKWITDLEVAYAFTPKFSLAIGANDAFDVYPDRSRIPDVTGVQYYAPNSPFGNSGGFYYVRANWTFD